MISKITSGEYEFTGEMYHNWDSLKVISEGSDYIWLDWGDSNLPIPSELSLVFTSDLDAINARVSELDKKPEPEMNNKWYPYETEDEYWLHYETDEYDAVEYGRDI